jgi:type IV pilus assembly protein PilV
MNNRFHSGHGQSSQTGVALLEALIAILVFSLGILTVISIQGTSVKLAADAQLRTKAALLAGRLVGQMWTSGDKIVDLEPKFKTGGSAYTAWLADVKTALPGVDSDTEPTVTVDISAGQSNGVVVITLFWRTPSMKPACIPPATPADSDCDNPHQHVVTSQISRNQI